MRPGLASVTVAPGRTAPEESVTVPPIVPTPWASAGSGRPTQHQAAKIPMQQVDRTCMSRPPWTTLVTDSCERAGAYSGIRVQSTANQHRGYKKHVDTIHGVGSGCRIWSLISVT